MEYTHVVKAKNLQIDKGYYLASYVAGTCARFINYEDDFQKSTDDDETADKKSQDRAKRYLTNVINEVSGFDSKTMRTLGTRYRKMYRESAAELSEVLENNGIGLLSPDDELTSFVGEPDDETDDANRERKFLEDYQARATNTACETIVDNDLVNQALRDMGICPRTGRDLGSPRGAERKRLYELMSATRMRGPRVKGNLAVNAMLVELERHKRTVLSNMRSCFKPLKEAGEMIDETLSAAIERRRKGDMTAIELGFDDPTRERASVASEKLLAAWWRLVGIEINRHMHVKIATHIRELQLKVQ